MSFELGFLPSLNILGYYLTFGFFKYILLSKNKKKTNIYIYIYKIS